MRLRDDLKRMIYSMAYVGELSRLRGLPPTPAETAQHQPALVGDHRRSDAALVGDNRRLNTSCARSAIELAEAAVRLHREAAPGRNEAG